MPSGHGSWSAGGGHSGHTAESALALGGLLRIPFLSPRPWLRGLSQAKRSEAGGIWLGKASPAPKLLPKVPRQLEGTGQAGTMQQRARAEQHRAVPVLPLNLRSFRWVTARGGAGAGQGGQRESISPAGRSPGQEPPPSPMFVRTRTCTSARTRAHGPADTHLGAHGPAHACTHGRARSPAHTHTYTHTRTCARGLCVCEQRPCPHACVCAECLYAHLRAHEACTPHSPVSTQSDTLYPCTHNTADVPGALQPSGRVCKSIRLLSRGRTHAHTGTHTHTDTQALASPVPKPWHSL